MKIEIDTKRDSTDEIKKVIKMLQHLVEDHSYFEAGNLAQSMPQSSGGSVGSRDSSASGATSSSSSSSYGSSEMPGLGFLGDDSVSSGSSSSSSASSEQQSAAGDGGSENTEDIDIDSFETY